MKIRLLVLSFAFFGFMACNQTPETNVDDLTDLETHHEDHGDEHADDHDHHHDGGDKVLALNNGQKWKADDITNEHVGNLINITDEFNAETAETPEEIHQFADKIQDELNLLIKDCTMDGPDHDTLHVWLEAVLNGVKEVKKKNDLSETKHSALELIENITKYKEFFE